MGSWGIHSDLRQPSPQLHPSSGRPGQAGLVFAFGEVLPLKQKPPGLSWPSHPATTRPDVRPQPSLATLGTRLSHLRVGAMERALQGAGAGVTCPCVGESVP